MMFKLMVSSSMISLTIIMIFLKHPLSMGLTILLQTLLTCMITGSVIKTYWFSYILFLIFLGGLLVLFIYISSIASNEIFYSSLNLKFFLFILFSLSLFLNIMFFNSLFKMNYMKNYDMTNYINNFIFFNNENKLSLTKLYNNQTFVLNMMMMIYLFITLITVVKIINIIYGPLRSF